MKEARIEALSKNLIDYDIRNQKSEIELAEEPMTHIMKVIQKFDVISPKTAKKKRWRRGSSSSKVCFITNTPLTVEKFLDDWKTKLERKCIVKKRKMTSPTFPPFRH